MSHNGSIVEQDRLTHDNSNYLTVPNPKGYAHNVHQSYNPYSYTVLYCYSWPDGNHNNMVKIGDTHIPALKIPRTFLKTDIDKAAREAAWKRIDEQFKGPNAPFYDIYDQENQKPYILEWAVAVENDPGNVVRDHRIHELLGRNGVSRVEFGSGKAMKQAAREWFSITPEQALEAVNTYLAGRITLKNDINAPIILRPEQDMFVNNTLEAWLKGDDERLWFAKMRFGKTITAYSFIKRTHETNKPINKVLILTNRPTETENSWKEDFQKVLSHNHKTNSKTDWQFGSRNYFETPETINKDNPFVWFISLQNLKGKDKENKEQFKEANKWVFDQNWDLVIIDEVHEGTETELAQTVLQDLQYEMNLKLSGTPFKLLAKDDVEWDKVDVWSYTDEQAAKEKWDYSQGDNPYAHLPKMWINTFDLRKDLKDKYLGEGADEAWFNFSTFFSATGTGNSREGKKTYKFEKEEDILKFLGTLTEPESTTGFMPYSPQRREYLRHTLWALPSQNACHAMKQLLETHPFFKEYKIIDVSGDSEESKKALENVKTAIGDDPMKTKTITLTWGQGQGRLTVGVSIPAWTGVLMLAGSNDGTSSASVYMQTIFRVQTPAYFNGQMKTDCYVWDFAPDRTLSVMVDVAGTSAKEPGNNTTQDQRDYLDTLLTFLPIISYTDSRDFKTYDAVGLELELKKTQGERVIHDGFDSDRLFVKALEKLSPEAREAIEAVRTVNDSSLPSTTNKPNVNETGNVSPDLDPLTLLPHNHIKTRPQLLSTMSDKELTVSVQEDENYLTTNVLSEDEREAVEAEKARKNAEQAKRKNIRNVLRTVSVRIPYMLIGLMGDPKFREEKLKRDFKLKDFTEKIDDESWKEFFGEIDKKTFLTLEECFDERVLQNSVTTWIEEIEAALALKDTNVDEYVNKIVSLMARIKNPNKETVLTPYDVVNRVYQNSWFKNEDAWKAVTKNSTSLDSQVKPTIFYDINVKTGLFPLYAAWHLSKTQGNPSTQSWDDIVNQHIRANSRTKAAQLVTATILGQTHEWAEKNITVIDVVAELKQLENTKLNEQMKHLYIGMMLTQPLSKMSDSFNAEKTMEQLIQLQKELVVVEKDKDMDSETKEQKKTEAIQAFQGDFKFDYTISNPPYQIQTGGKTHQIYDRFYLIGAGISHKLAMIFPRGWQTSSGKASGSSQHIKLRADSSIVLVDNYYEENNSPIKLFPTAGTGGVNIIVRDDTKHSELVKYYEYGQFTDERSLMDYQKYSGYTKNIFDKLKGWMEANSVSSTKEKISGWNPFGVLTYYLDPRRPEWEQVSTTQQEGYIPVWGTEKSKTDYRFYWVPANFEDENGAGIKTVNIGKYKLVWPKSGAWANWRFSLILKPGEICTDTFIGVWFDTEEEAKNYQTYLKTKFYRFAISENAPTHNAYRGVHEFVPDLVNIVNPRTNRVGYSSDWTDEDLKKVFESVLTNEDWEYIVKTALTNDKGRE